MCHLGHHAPDEYARTIRDGERWGVFRPRCHLGHHAPDEYARSIRDGERWGVFRPMCHLGHHTPDEYARTIRDGERWGVFHPMCHLGHHTPDEYARTIRDGERWRVFRRPQNWGLPPSPKEAPLADGFQWQEGVPPANPHYLSGLGTGIESGWLATPDG